ncbi:hypothetical protein KQX54_004528 [Cotesia glomerata]|uniref:Uncharacterized protein n=1 Tax=Cotesia glomerata TaxID=32391 RepID=A0AAV7ICU5_COTGL|nr:hypothetical protein KQX54_004528 [Cotesia glomerata]
MVTDAFSRRIRLTPPRAIRENNRPDGVGGLTTIDTHSHQESQFIDAYPEIPHLFSDASVLEPLQQHCLLLQSVIVTMTITKYDLVVTLISVECINPFIACCVLQTVPITVSLMMSSDITYRSTLSDTL